MKRINHIIPYLLLLIILFNLVVPIYAAPVDLKILSEAAILMETTSGDILFQKNQDSKMHPASVTKLMVMLLVLEALDQRQIKLTDVVTASPEACRMGGSQIWLEPGEQMTVAELLKAISIVSANDASYALGEHIAGSEEAFIELMNKRAKDLDLKNTHYVNTTGLEPENSGEGNLTSALDMAKLGREVLKHPLILQWTGTWIDSLRYGKSFLRNTNKLVRFYRGCDGLKTGFTGEAGYCLVATAKRDGVRMIVSVMKADTDKTRASDISKLFNYGFSQYKSFQVYKGGETIGKVPIFRGLEKSVAVVVPSELTAVVKRDQKGTIDKKITIDSLVQAPLKQGQKVGEIELLVDGKLCGKIDLVSAKEIKRASIVKIWFDLFKSIIAANVTSYSR